MNISETDLQARCERGQQELMETAYLKAVATLSEAEEIAWQARSFDTLARLYLPLQEARRQIRQRCGEGAVKMHQFPTVSNTWFDAQQVLTEYPNAQLLVAGWGSIAPSVEVRQLAALQQQYVETFLGAVFPMIDAEPVVVISPLAETPLPAPDPRTFSLLRSLLPPRCLIFNFQELPADAPRGNSDTFAAVMAMWEKLHLPFLAAANQETDPIRRMQAYRLTLQVDPACELAHQHLADVARSLRRV